MSEKLLEMASSYPIRKIVRYRGNMNPMIYMIGKPYGGDKLKMCAMECVVNEGKKEYYLFVNKRNPETGKFDDNLQYLWKTEKAEDLTVEYNLNFDEI